MTVPTWWMVHACILHAHCFFQHSWFRTQTPNCVRRGLAGIRAKTKPAALCMFVHCLRSHSFVICVSILRTLDCKIWKSPYIYLPIDAPLKEIRTGQVVKSGHKIWIKIPGVNRNVPPLFTCDPIDQKGSLYQVWSGPRSCVKPANQFRDGFVCVPCSIHKYIHTYIYIHA